MAFLAGVLKDVLGGVMPFLIVTIITLSGIIILICSTILKDKLKPDGLMNNAFNVRIGWLILRILAVVFAWMTFLRIGSKVIYSDETGGLLLLKFIANISGSILICSSIFTAINGIRFVKMSGPIFRPVMRPLFTLPGRSTVDNLASFIGDGTVGVLITSRQYGEGYYSRHKA